MTIIRRTAARALVLALVLGVLGPLTANVAAASPTSAEQLFVDLINRERENRGLAALRVDAGLRGVARDWSSTMTSDNRLYHNPNLARQVDGNVDGSWTRLAENVGRTRLTGAEWTQLVERLHRALMDSSGHRANILGDYNHAGVGVTIGSDGTMWVTQVFMRGTTANVAGSAGSGGSWKGVSGQAIPITGDWNGNGRVTPGWFDNGRVYLWNRHGGGAPDVRFSFGRAGDVPVVGDWNGDGRDTIGIVRGRHWHLRFSNTGGRANRSFVFGRLTAGDYPLVGDWNGDGRDTVGIVRKGEWHLRHILAGGAADHVFVYGRVLRGDIPVVGDWNGDGRDTPAIIRGSEWHIRLRNAAGRADRVFRYGASGDTPVVGDWNGNRRTGPGVVRGDGWHLRDHLSGGRSTTSYRL